MLKFTRFTETTYPMFSHNTGQTIQKPVLCIYTNNLTKIITSQPLSTQTNGSAS